jgi:homocysteine S-methyltransferase
VDLLAFETIPTIREAAVLLDLLAESGAMAWLSYQCRDGESTAAGEPVAAAFALAADAPGIVAVGVNCGPPRHVPALLAAAAAAAPDTPLIAYPNAGDRWDADARRWVATEGSGYDPAQVASWTAAGAAWIGGCCGTGPADIAALAVAVGARTA